MNPQSEILRLTEDARRAANWKRWGPYLSDRQWATVREDYSQNGDAWNYFPFAHSHARAYRWGEDGLLGFTDRECRLCLALALWNGRDPILKERLFGLTNEQGNHGEDVKECYFYLDATPTASYCKALYKYPQTEFPYEALLAANRGRGRELPEVELLDIGAFDDDRYFDVFAEYAKAGPDDVLLRVTAHNRGPDVAPLAVLPTVWFRNTWAWGEPRGEGAWGRPSLRRHGPHALDADHASLGRFRVAFSGEPDLVFTENETNAKRVFGSRASPPYSKDAFHDYVVHARTDAVMTDGPATKAAGVYHFQIPPGGSVELRVRLTAEAAFAPDALGEPFDAIFADRIAEADAFYATKLPPTQSDDEAAVARQAYAGLLWTKQFYHYVVKAWEDGDPSQPKPPPGRGDIRNGEWPHVYCRDVLSMPDKWEYPWFAAWDLAFHMIPMARIDPHFAKEQLLLLLREWYMHANGQIPAFEWELGDVNPPVHAWACWRVYKLTGPKGKRDRTFLARAFHKLLLNFTWWVNRKDVAGNNLFAGGFLGLDNVSVFDRSKPLPGGGRLEQADGTAWMAFFCLTMLAIALELAREDPAYEDVASKFFEHFVAIADAMNTVGGTGLWDDRDGFYYDRLHVGAQTVPARLKSVVGLLPLIAVEVLEDSIIDRLPGFKKRLTWFLQNRQDLAACISYLEPEGENSHGHRLLAIPSRERLRRTLTPMLDEKQLLSPYGVRSLSAAYREEPYVFRIAGDALTVRYVPGDSDSWLFGGNSNWRGPVWFPVNYLLVEALERYHHFYGPTFQVECPTGSGQLMTLQEVSQEIARRLTRLFLPDRAGKRPCHGGVARYADDPYWKELVLFYEYFHGDDGRGLGASHQTGWTAVVARLLEDRGRACGPDGSLCAIDWSARK